MVNLLCRFNPLKFPIDNLRIRSYNTRNEADEALLFYDLSLTHESVKAIKLEETEMKTMKKTIALLLALVMSLALVACGGQGDDGVYHVGVVQLVQHDALDAATKGFKDALTAELGDKVVFDVQNASNEIPMCSTIVDKFVANNVDLIMANATPALQAASAATKNIPILGTSVTEYGVALEIKNFSGTVGGNISGTSDLAPLDEQAAMVQELFPDATTVGLLYCSAEPNSVYQITVMEGYLTEMGYTCAQYAFADVNELSAVTQTACDGSDVIYIPTDNTCATYTETIANVVLTAGVPVVAGEAGICSGCGVATLSIDYYDLGTATGKMAAKILKGEANVSEMPVEFAPQVTKMYNAANCDALGIAYPAGYEPIG